MITLDKPDILDTIRAEGVELKQRGRHYWGLCPFHAERTPSFKIDSERGSFYCFGCGAHGDSIEFIEKLRGLSFREALGYLGIDTSVKPNYETLLRIRRAKEKAELIRKFRKWEVDYHSELCDFYRTLQKLKMNVKSEADLNRISWLYHSEPLWLHRLDILESRDDKQKYQLYCEVNG